MNLSTESVKSSALSLESVDNVEGSDGLSLSVLGVGDGVTDDVLEEDLENTSGLFVDEARDAFDATSSSESSNRGLGDALDVVAHDLAVTLGAALSKTLSAFASSRHVSLNLTLSEVWPGWLRLLFIFREEVCEGDNPAARFCKKQQGVLESDGVASYCSLLQLMD